MDVDQMRECISQINYRNRFNLASISGGRVENFHGKLRLPVSNGYTVEVELKGNDTYTVRRLFIRRPKGSLIPVEHVKGERTEVYADDLGQATYYASCFRSYDADKWPDKI